MKELTAPQTAFLRNLRSGEIKQIRGALRKRNVGNTVGMCCLGVGTHTFHVETGQGKWIDCPDTLLDMQFDVDDSTTGIFMPKAAATWLGLDDVNPVLAISHADPTGEQRFFASTLNDTYFMDFDFIAFLFEHLFRHGKPMVLNNEETKFLNDRGLAGEEGLANA